jgi:Spy/CpxP family protein refolding chaperone
MTQVLELPRRNRNRTRAALLFTLLLVASALLGAAVDHVAFRPGGPLFRDSEFHPLSSVLRSPTDEDRTLVLRQLSRELELDAGQEAAIRGIMQRNSGEFQALRAELRPRVELLVTHVREQIDQVLTPAQRVRFQSLQQAESNP